MKITSEILEKQWKSINYTSGGFLQVYTQHSLEWFIGYQSVSQRTLLLVSNTEISTIESSKSIIVSRRRRETDNRWTLSFELLRDEQQDVFVILCCDIIEFSKTAISEAEALKLVINRYKQWSKLLEIQSKGLMDEQRQKGLLGELLFLEQYICRALPFLEAIQGWSGAEGADQDFMYSESWYEVKSIVTSAISATISSLEQLDCPTEGELVIMRIDKSPPTKAGAVSLYEVAQRIKNILSGDVLALELFQAKLMAYGYLDIQEYAEQKYIHSDTQRYRVDNSFPRLTKKNVPHQISKSQYEIDLPSLNPWRKE
jgi:hypothetical protein